MTPRRVLHLVHDTLLDPRHRYLGSTKGIRCRTEYFEARGISYDEVPARRNPAAVLRAVCQSDLSTYGTVIFEHTQSPAALRYVRRTAPDVRIITSSHNAELYHRWDIVRAAGLRSFHPRTLKHALTKPYYDFACGRLSDYVLAVSDWEVARYWNRLMPKVRARYMPWHLPEQYAKELPGAREKRDVCVCLMSTAPNPLILDATRRFREVVSRLGGKASGWSFLVTGEAAWMPGGIGTADVGFTGFLESPYELISEARAIALVSDLGYGFKTKIMEAALCGTYSIVGSGLYERIPTAMKKYCVPVKIGSTSSFLDALEECRAPFPEGDPNSEARDRAFAVLDEATSL